VSRAALVAVAAAGVSALVIGRRYPEFSVAGAAVAAEVLAGWALAAAGFAAGSRLLVAAAVAWLLAEWNNPGVGSALVFTVGLVAPLATPPLVAHAALTPPRALIVCGYAVAAFGLAPVLVFDAAACGDCPRDLLRVAGHPGVLTGVWLVLTATWALAAIVAATLRTLRASPARQRLAAPLRIPAAVYLASVAFEAASSGAYLDRELWAVEALALAALAGGVAWGLARSRHTRAALARLTVELPPGGLRAALANRLGEPGLQLVYAVDGAWVDLAGRPADAPATQLLAGGRVIAGLNHLPGDPGAAGEIAAAARLALEHERLQAEINWRLAHLRASRARIVAAGDAERRRLERDLHDGAQQRLVTLALALQFAERHHPDGQLGAARQDVLAALEDLREIAHGIHPMALTDGGLSAGVEALAERRPQLRAGTLTEERFDPALESAAYFTIAETLRHTEGPVDVDVKRSDHALVIELHASSIDLTEIEDRVGALDGRLRVHPDGFSAELPCAS
jgi:signal transduction histidine kinase